MWLLEYPDFFPRNLLNWLLRRPKPVSCLTYGKTPPGYQQKIAALSLEPEQLYHVKIWGNGGLSEILDFIIRLNDAGIPTQLEYALEGSEMQILVRE